MKIKNTTPSEEVLNILKESLKDYYVLNRDNMWGKEGEIVKHEKDYGTPSRQNSSWKASGGNAIPLVACGLQSCLESEYVIPLYTHILNGGKIQKTKLASFMNKYSEDFTI